MGGQTSIERKTFPQTLLDSFGIIKKEVATLEKSLNKISQSHTLSSSNEDHLSQIFLRIENQVTNLQNQIDAQKNSLIWAKLEELHKFFLNIEWDISDIKTATQPNWKSVYSIIKRIQMFMEPWKNFPKFETCTTESFKPQEKEKVALMEKIKELEEKLQRVDEEINMFFSES